MSDAKQVPANTLGYGSAIISVRSGNVMDVEVFNTLGEAQEDVAFAKKLQSERVTQRLRWAIVAIVEQAP